MRPNVLVPLELACLVAISSWIVLEKRPPIATLLWILLVAALPIGGPVIFLLLGPRRARRSRFRRALAERRLRASLPDPRDLLDPSSGFVKEALEPRFQQLITLRLNNSESAVTSGNLVRVLRNGSECFPAIEAAIGEAQHHVHLEYYIFQEGETGRRLRDLLVERARAGVQVRLLVDAFGSGLSRAFLRPMRDAGVEVEAFNRLRLSGHSAATTNFRSHRKIVICDGDVAFTGGLNVGDSYAGRDPKRPLRDTHVRIEGPAAHAFQILFLQDWHLACGRSVNAPGFFGAGERPGNEIVQVVASGADRSWYALHQLFFTAITSAQERVWISTPYFVPDPALLTALIAAALRGVDVKVLLPRKSDSAVVAAAGRSFYDELLAAGVRIFEYLPGFLHAKSLVVDRRCSTIGSANFDRRSFHTDFEVNAFFFSPTIASELEAMFIQDLTVSGQCKVEDRLSLPLGQRLAEAVAHLLAPIL